MPCIGGGRGGVGDLAGDDLWQASLYVIFEDAPEVGLDTTGVGIVLPRLAPCDKGVLVVGLASSAVVAFGVVLPPFDPWPRFSLRCCLEADLYFPPDLVTDPDVDEESLDDPVVAEESFVGLGFVVESLKDPDVDEESFADIGLPLDWPLDLFLE